VGQKVKTAVHKYINTNQTAGTDAMNHYTKSEIKVKKKKKRPESIEREHLEFPVPRNTTTKDVPK